MSFPSSFSSESLSTSSNFIETISASHWKDKQKQSILLAYNKGKIIEEKISDIVSKIVSYPLFEIQYPAIAAKLKEIYPIRSDIFKPFEKFKKKAEDEICHFQDKIEEIQWIARDLIPVLNEGREDLVDVEFAKRVYNAAQELARLGSQSVTRNGKGVVAIPADLHPEDYLLIVDFCSSVDAFFSQHAEYCCRPDIFYALFRENPPESERQNIFSAAKEDILNLKEKMVERVNAMREKIESQAVKKYHAKYQPILQELQKGLMVYEPFFCVSVRVVRMIGESLLPALSHQRYDDHYLTGGLQLLADRIQQQSQAILKVVMASPEYDQNEIKSIDKVLPFQQQFIRSSADQQFKAACEVMERKRGENMPSYIHIHALCVMASKSQECPGYYKKQAKQLSKKINEFDEKKAEGEAQKAQESSPQADCSIM